MMRILVTGATGFVGGTLVRRLLADGHTVIANGRAPEKLAALAAMGAQTFAYDLASPGLLPEIAPFDVIVHCAALSAPWGPLAAFESANIEGTRKALLLARAGGARRIVHISTPSIYFCFEDHTNTTEGEPLPKPVNAYARTKRTAESMVLAADDLDPVVLRPRGIYGRGDTALLPRLLNAAAAGPLPLMRGGEAVIDLTHVDDVVGAILAAINAPPELSVHVFNVSSGEALPIRTIVEAAAARAGIPVTWRPVQVQVALAYARGLEFAARFKTGNPEPRVTAYGIGLFAFNQSLNLKRAREHIGWRPSIPFTEGLARTFDKAE
jgi:nucleoside-diphosphate-sugar epimerase